MQIRKKTVNRGTRGLLDHWFEGLNGYTVTERFLLEHANNSILMVVDDYNKDIRTHKLVALIIKLILGK